MSDIYEVLANYTDEDSHLAARIYTDGEISHVFILSRVPVEKMNGMITMVWGMKTDVNFSDNPQEALASFVKQFRAGLEVRGSHINMLNDSFMNLKLSIIDFGFPDMESFWPDIDRNIEYYFKNWEYFVNKEDQEIQLSFEIIEGLLRSSLMLFKEYLFRK